MARNGMRVGAAFVAACVAAAAFPAFAGDLPRPLDDSDYRPFSEERAALGRLLFYDKELSGNRNIACATCHHHDLATTDGLSLPAGEGGVGLGRDRTGGIGPSAIERRMPRHTLQLFNLGAREFDMLFHDGRLAVDPTDPTGFDSPAEEELPPGLDNVLAAFAMFPVASDIEMAGDPQENEIGAAAAEGPERVWPLVARRLAAIPEYVALFRRAFSDIDGLRDITMVHAATAISDFIASEWRADTSPFDAHLRGDTDALNDKARRGMRLFYGKAGCDTCHSGAFQTDHDFHAIAMPQFGPGRTRGFAIAVRDEGRLNETDRVGDRYRFRTPSLRNVAATAPYGHTGAYRTLEAVVRHHLDPAAALASYDPSQAILPQSERLAVTDFLALGDEREKAAILAASELRPLALDDTEVAALVAFLEALTDPDGIKGRLGRPERVPSGLPVD